MMWTCTRCGRDVRTEDRPRSADGKLKNHCGCRTGLGGRGGTSKYGVSTLDMKAWRKECRWRGLPGFKAPKRDAHVLAYKAHLKAAPKKIDLNKPLDAHVRAWIRAKPSVAWAHRYRTDAAFNAKEKFKASVRRKLKDGEISRYMSFELKRGRLRKKWEYVLGYTFDSLAIHLLRTIPKGYTWDDFLSGALHIDHIVPRKEYNLNDEEEVRKCWCLSNLRLISAQENMSKSDKRLFLL